jgi:hypothetical protein
MFGLCRGTRALKVAVLAIYTAFSLFGGMFHTWAHHASGDGGFACCSTSGEPNLGCDDVSNNHSEHPSGHSYCYTCTKHGQSATQPDCRAIPCESVTSPPSDSQRVATAIGPSPEHKKPARNQVNSGRHACPICDKIASLLQSWSAPLCDISSDFPLSDRCCESCSNGLSRGIFMARSRAPPARI